MLSLYFEAVVFSSFTGEAHFFVVGKGFKKISTFSLCTEMKNFVGLKNSSGGEGAKESEA